MHELNANDANAPIVKEIHIEAPPAIVYEYLTQADKIMQWMGIEVDANPQPGGILRIAPNRFDVIRGEYLEAIPFSKVKFTWGLEGEGHGLPPGSTLVEISLEPTATGTQLRLVHSNLPDAEWREEHSVGWERYLARIAAVAQGRPPGPDPFASATHGIT